jgi:hypothetical protein
MAELAILGLTSNILQFLELGTKLFLKAKEIHDSVAGASAENELLEAEVAGLKRQVELLKIACAKPEGSNSPAGSAIGRQLRAIAVDCDAAGKEIIGLLNGQKVDAQSRWRYGRALIKATTDQRLANRKLAAKARLEGLHDRLFKCLALDIKNQQSVMFDVIKDLQARSDALESSTTDALGGIKTMICSRIPEPADVKTTRLHTSLYSSLASDLNSLSSEARDVRKRDMILGSLHFTTMRERQTAIKD